MTCLSTSAALRFTLARMFAGTIMLALLVFAQDLAAEPFAAKALRGMHRFNVAVDGIKPDFARYGLSSDEVRTHVEDKLRAAGLEVADDVTAVSDAEVGQVRIKLSTVEGSYGYYSYALAVQARRKIQLSADGGFVSQNVWANGQSGISNPSELPGKIYPVVDQLLANFLAALGNDNGAAGAH